MVELLDKLSNDKKIAAFLDMKCKKRFQFKGKYDFYRSSTLAGDSQDDVINDLDELLLKNSPGVINYNSNLLTKGQNHSSSVSDHVSTVIARKYNKSLGRCEYLIKNSWGSDCVDTPSLRCEKGNYWVSRTALRNNLTSVEWMKKK